MADFTQMFLQGLQAGQAQKKSAEERQQQIEELKLRKEQLAHQAKAQALQIKELEQRGAKQQFDFMQGAPAPVGDISQGVSGVQGGGQFDLGAAISAAQQGQSAPRMDTSAMQPLGQHAPIAMPSMVEGGAPVMRRPDTDVQMLQKQAQVDAQALQKFEQQRQIIEATRAPQRPVQPNEATLALAAAGGDAKAKAALALLNPASTGETITPLAEATAALLWRKTGQMPSLGFGAAGAAARTRVMNRAATLSPEEIAALEGGGLDLAGNKMDFMADKASLTALQRTRDSVTAFEKTALRNIDIFLETTKKAIDTGSPLINQPVRTVAGTLFGSKNLAAFNAARTIALTESAKVLNNPNLSGVLSDSARKEVESLLSPNATVGQAYAVFNLLKNEMKGRTGYLDETIAEIKGRGKAGSSNTAPAPLTATNAQGVKIISTDGGQTWKPVQ